MLYECVTKEKLDIYEDYVSIEKVIQCCAILHERTLVLFDLWDKANY